MLFGQRVKELRQQKKLSKRVVYTHLKITRTPYDRLENGSRKLNCGESLKLCQLFDITPNEFFKIGESQNVIDTVSISQMVQRSNSPKENGTELRLIRGVRESE